MPIRPWNMGEAQRQAYQGWRPGNAIEGLYGPPYGFGYLTDALSLPLDPTNVAEQLGQAGLFEPQNIEVRWVGTTLTASTQDQVVQAYPNRVVLVVQNQSPTNALAVNFDQAASVSGASPNQTSQGILLLPGVSLYIDRWCPTGTVHIAASGAGTPSPVISGLSSIGNVPELLLTEQLSQMNALLTALLERLS